MRAFVAVSTIIFGLISIAHVWRATVERRMLHQPWWVVLTLFGFVLFFWGLSLLMRKSRT
jgi:preprotein translocase subunit SecE